MKKKRREKFVRKNPKKNTPKEERLLIRAKYGVHDDDYASRARFFFFFFFSLNLSRSLSLCVCVCVRERDSRSSSTI